MFVYNVVNAVHCNLLTNFMRKLSYPAYYRGAMGMLLVYDVADESSFNSILLTPLSLQTFGSCECSKRMNSLQICLLYDCFVKAAKTANPNVKLSAGIAQQKHVGRFCSS